MKFILVVEEGDEVVATPVSAEGVQCGEETILPPGSYTTESIYMGGYNEEESLEQGGLVFGIIYEADGQSYAIPLADTADIEEEEPDFPDS